MPITDEFNFIRNDLSAKIWRIIYDNHKQLENNTFDYAGEKALDKIVDEIIEVVLLTKELLKRMANNASNRSTS